MLQIYPDEGLVSMLLSIVDNNSLGLTWALYSNDVSPNLDSVLTDFTLINSSWAQRILTAGDFSYQQVALHIGTIQADAIAFVNTSGSTKTAYGYVVFNQHDSQLVAAARFDDAPETVLNTKCVRVSPIIGDHSASLTPIIDGGTF